MKRIPLNDGRFALVDDGDYEALARHKWYVIERRGLPYAARQEWERGVPRTVRMHRLIADAKPGEIVDHANRDTLDNRRANLRKCTASENAANQRKRITSTSPFKGVRKNRSGWQARMCHNGKRLHLGYFGSAKDAAIAYDRAATEIFGTFARRNFTEAA